MIHITLLGEPKSTQHIYRYTCRSGYVHGYMSEEGKTLKEDYQWQAKSQYKGRPLSAPLSVCIDLYFKSRRKHDIDNFNKLILDALSSIVWQDDSQIQELTITKSVDVKKPRAEVRVYDL